MLPNVPDFIKGVSRPRARCHNHCITFHADNASHNPALGTRFPELSSVAVLVTQVFKTDVGLLRSPHDVVRQALAATFVTDTCGTKFVLPHPPSMNGMLAAICSLTTYRRRAIHTMPQSPLGLDDATH